MSGNHDVIDPNGHVQHEVERVTTPIEVAQAGAARTDAAVSLLRGFVDQIADLHAENNYVPRLRAIFRNG